VTIPDGETPPAILRLESGTLENNNPATFPEVKVGGDSELILTSTVPMKATALTSEGSGTLRVQSGDLEVAGGLWNGSKIILDAGTSLTITGELNVVGNFEVSGAGTFSNNGKIIFSGGMGLQVPVSGEIQVSGGSLQITSDSQLDTLTLDNADSILIFTQARKRSTEQTTIIQTLDWSGGTIDSRAILSVGSLNIHTNMSKALYGQLSSQNASIEEGTSIGSNIATPGYLELGGDIVFSTNYIFGSPPTGTFSLSILGTATLIQGSEVVVFGDYLLAAGGVTTMGQSSHLNLNGGNFANDGTLEARNRITGVLNNRGSLFLGSQSVDPPPGRHLSLNGFSQGPQGTLTMKVGGASPDLSDTIEIAQSGSVSGTLSVILISGLDVDESNAPSLALLSITAPNPFQGITGRFDTEEIQQDGAVVANTGIVY